MSIINISYTVDDIKDMAEDAGVEFDEAMERVMEWEKHITSTALDLISEQLHSVVTTGLP